MVEESKSRELSIEDNEGGGGTFRSKNDKDVPNLKISETSYDDETGRETPNFANKKPLSDNWHDEVKFEY
jgi:hypothetical protein